MSAPIPRSKPQASLTVVMDAALTGWKAAGKSGALPDMFVLAVRGYYRDSMGVVGKNDAGMYDDAFFIVSPLGFQAYNGNTDPSRYGWNANAGKWMARLKTGVWTFRRLKHHASRPDGYMAFGQGGDEVAVERIDSTGKIRTTETGCFGMNLHHGGINGTSSEGCLTVPKEQWPAFDARLSSILKSLGLPHFPLILIEGPIA